MRKRLGPINVEVNAWAINRPHLDWWPRWDEHGRFGIGVGLSWGNGNSDPVWLIDIDRIPLPRWLGRRLA